MREKRPRDVWRLYTRFLYSLSVSECVFVMYTSDTLLCCLHLCLHPASCWNYYFFFPEKKKRYSVFLIPFND